MSKLEEKVNEILGIDKPEPKKEIVKQEFKPLKVQKTFAQERMEDFNKKYPSWTGDSTYTTPDDQSWKAEESKNFTVAPAYNKGAYQVIPKRDIKQIGK